MAHTLDHTLGFECTCRDPAPARFGAGIRGFVMHAAKQLHSWHQRQRQRQTMANLDERLLADFGITIEAAAREAAKPFWARPQAI